ncbi:NlpC/P60 family protein [Anaerocolumna sp. AGMB13025]|uniref:C40 family peptidase n=1 Tax=Anaerocolumna sp. AGMB13025 TaxID=3039116 RepID=UPI00241C1C10|nr:NlpC/P60 family protein [Anaerocolumna sp. AGMB13025]WFR57826.1 NlpC/P60 family protein [Anaerocolumna sp. AGMB13025]
MMKGMAVKASLCATAILLSLSFSVTAKAATSTSDKGIAGITPVLDNYYTATADKKTGSAEKLMETLSNESKKAVKLSATDITKVESPYANLGISIASESSYVNIRSKPDQESEVVGKLYPGCAADILETQGDWVKIKSGKVDGYIKSEFLAIGEEAEKLIDKVASKYVIVDTETLRVREGQGTDTDIVALIPQGEKYYIVNEYNEWVEILIDEDDSDGSGAKDQITGFVSKDLVKIEVEFKYAISIEEEKAKLEAEEKAKKAEADRLEQLAKEQEAQRQKEAQDKAEAENKAENNEQTRNDSSNNSSTDNSSSNNNTDSNSGSSSSGSEVANYALNFVGNPYVYGGTSLTGGTDCSGFVQSIYSHFGYSISRTSSSQSQSAGKEVSLSNLQAGDLIFYRNSGGSVSHVAMYIGGGKVVHASNPRDGIKVSNYNYRTPYKARRVMH